jgi:hypothetical protein|uniref:Uncharacterized protein n=1 Tax=Fagus sylvatica TaxID=28930 RepID=A0A2N9FF79_FAGSY
MERFLMRSNLFCRKGTIALSKNQSNIPSLVWIRSPTLGRLKRSDIPRQEEMAKSSDIKITEMIAQLMARQEEFKKDMGACMTRFEEEKLKKPQVENFEDKDKPFGIRKIEMNTRRTKRLLLTRLLLRPQR